MRAESAEVRVLTPPEPRSYRRDGDFFDARPRRPGTVHASSDRTHEAYAAADAVLLRVE